MDNVNRLSITRTVARQTPKNEFGQVLKNTVSTGAKLAGQIVGGLAGMPIVSAAVSSVTAMAGGSSAGSAAGRTTTSSAATGIVSIGPTTGSNGGVTGTATVGSTGTTGIATGTEPIANGVEPQNFDSYLQQMRAESDRSMMMQMQMQQESRDYNTLSNVIKVRHDSAKAAINNIR